MTKGSNNLFHTIHSSTMPHMDDVNAAQGPSKSQESKRLLIPKGYVVATTKDGRQCLLPQVIIDASEHMHQSLINSEAMGVLGAGGGVSV